MSATEFSPVGIIGDSARVLSLATKLADGGRRVLLHLPRVIALAQPIKRVERVATPTDIAFECAIVLIDIRDDANFRDVVIGTRDCMGLGAEMQPGTQVVDMAVRPPRELQAILGLLGTRGISVLDAALLEPSALRPHLADQIILLGGFPDAVAQAEPTLTLLGRVVKTGQLGSAHATAAITAAVELQIRQAMQSAGELAAHLNVSDALLRELTATQRDLNDTDELAHRARVASLLAEHSGFEFRSAPLPITAPRSALDAAHAEP